VVEPLEVVEKLSKIVVEMGSIGREGRIVDEVGSVGREGRIVDEVDSVGKRDKFADKVSVGKVGKIVAGVDLVAVGVSKLEVGLENSKMDIPGKLTAVERYLLDK
jgi:hypothetical protein